MKHSGDLWSHPTKSTLVQSSLQIVVIVRLLQLSGVIDQLRSGICALVSINRDLQLFRQPQSFVSWPIYTDCISQISSSLAEIFFTGLPLLLNNHHFAGKIGPISRNYQEDPGPRAPYLHSSLTFNSELVCTFNKC